MRQPYFAFYWTFPIPSVGFKDLSDDIEKAARESRTIRFQRDKIRTHVREVGGDIVPDGEIVRIESRPDRGSKKLAKDLSLLIERADLQGAKVAVIDFSAHGQWRGHQYLEPLYKQCDTLRVDYDEVHLGGINPYDHFEKRRREQHDRTAAKPDHRRKILATLAESAANTLVSKAELLNRKGLKTHTGKMWKAANLGRFLAREDDDTDL